MTKEEIIKKLSDVSKDIKKGEQLLSSLNHKTISSAEEFVNDCQTNKDYAPIILTRKVASNLAGLHSFREINFASKLNVLKCVVDALKYMN